MITTIVMMVWCGDVKIHTLSRFHAFRTGEDLQDNRITEEYLAVIRQGDFVLQPFGFV